MLLFSLMVYVVLIWLGFRICKTNPGLLAKLGKAIQLAFTAARAMKR